MGGIDFASVDDKWIESRVQPIQHPEFNIQTQLNDIALLKLATPIVAYQSSVLPICLPDADMEFDGTQSFVSGWGRLGESIQLVFCFLILFYFHQQLETCSDQTFFRLIAFRKSHFHSFTICRRAYY